jgi:hypothetical protein
MPDSFLPHGITKDRYKDGILYELTLGPSPG